MLISKSKKKLQVKAGNNKKLDNNPSNVDNPLHKQSSFPQREVLLVRCVQFSLIENWKFGIDNNKNRQGFFSQFVGSVFAC